MGSRLVKFLLLGLVVGALGYVGGLLSLWFSVTGKPGPAIQSPKEAPLAAPAAGLPAARTQASLPQAVPPPQAVEAVPSVPRPETREPDRTDFGPQNYNPWTDEPPKTE